MAELKKFFEYADFQTSFKILGKRYEKLAKIVGILQFWTYDKVTTISGMA